MKYANEFAPKTEGMTIFFKQTPLRGKSDGFAVISKEEVWVIDAGHYHDHGMHAFLLSLREQWLEKHPDEETRKLQIDLLITHPHGDHIRALPEIVKDPRIDIRSVTAPTRSYLAGAVEGALPTLTADENRLDELERDLGEYGHTARRITRIPFGEKAELPFPDGKIEIYAAPFDWSETRESEDEGFLYIDANVPASYGDRRELANSNGILNSNSLWFKFCQKDRSVLFTGDQRPAPQFIRRMVEHYGKENFRCDVLKYLHHGEKNHCPYLMEVTSPQITVFTASAGAEDPRAVALCKEVGRLYCVGKGELFLTLNGEGIFPEGIEAEQ